MSAKKKKKPFSLFTAVVLTCVDFDSSFQGTLPYLGPYGFVWKWGWCYWNLGQDTTKHPIIRRVVPL